MSDSGSLKMHRRGFIAALGAGVATILTMPASAQTVMDDLLVSPKRGNWDDQFDAQSNQNQTSSKVTSTVPIFSSQTVANVQRAIEQYQSIVNAGGWPQVPGSAVKLKVGASDSSVSILRQRLMVSGDLSKSAGTSNQFDSYVDGAVKRFQARHGFPTDGVVGQYTLAAMNISADVRLMQLQTNLGRIAAQADQMGDRYVMVNVPAAAVEAVEGGRVAQRHTAVVGRIDRQSPILDSVISNVMINPYWNAPVSIIEKDIIPLMQKDSNYLSDNAIHILRPDGSEIDPVSVDWNSNEAASYRLRQDPGPHSAMASMKINYPNKFDTYMHDTPKQGLFNKIQRFESSGCVRVQNVRDLGVWILKDTPGWGRAEIEAQIATGQNLEVPLGSKVNVHFTYITAWSTAEDVVHFRDDIYKKDGAQELAINSGVGQAL